MPAQLRASRRESSPSNVTLGSSPRSTVSTPVNIVSRSAHSSTVAESLSKLEASSGTDRRA